MEKKKILFVNDEMTMGGVARILNTLLSFIDYEKFEVDLLVLHTHGELINEIPTQVNIIEGTKFFNTIDIPLKQCSFENIFSKIRLLFYMKTGLINKKIITERKKILNKKYDIEFSAKEGFCTVFVSAGDSINKLNWIQVDYAKSNYSRNHMNLVKNSLKKIDCNIACSEVVKKSYSELFDVDNINVVNNLIDETLIRNKSLEIVEYEVSDKINIICVARFHHQKGLDRLIRVYAKLKDHYSLTIIGDGELKDELYSLAKNLNVFDDINWLGLRSNPYPFIRKNDLFILPSLYEGYPTITIETLISQTPILAMEVAGIKEQMLKDEYGWVIDNDENSLYLKLEELKNNKDLILAHKEKLAHYHYNNELIMNTYYNLFEKG